MRRVTKGRPIGHDVLEAGEHAACVDAWLERAARGRSPQVRLQLFEAALGALWARTATTLGEVTLTAIVGRVLHDASEKFPPLAALQVEPIGVTHYRELGERMSSVTAAEQAAGLRFVLVELLTVLGRLTAEILSPELHSALSAVAVPPTKGEGKRP